MASAVGPGASRDTQGPGRRRPGSGDAGREGAVYNERAEQTRMNNAPPCFCQAVFIDHYSKTGTIYPLERLLAGAMIAFLGYYVNLFGVFGFLLGEYLLLLHRLSVERRNKIHQSPRNARG